MADTKVEGPIAGVKVGHLREQVRGLVIDMTPMRTVRVDPRSKTARADAGATWGDFNHATHAFGLATTGGIISTTGVTGLTLGGGIGYLARACGLSIDKLISADVVT